MDVTIGEAGLKKTWQASFEKVISCDYCGGDARIAFVAHEGLDSKSVEHVCDLHQNEMGDGGSFWLHDVCAVAVYFCGACGEPSVKYNQA